MWTFFWLTLVAAILALLHSYQKGEEDNLGCVKVVFAGVVMIILVVYKCSTGEDALNEDDHKNYDFDQNNVNPYHDHNLPQYSKEYEEWRKSLGSGILDSMDVE